MKRLACVLLVSLILPLAGCGAAQNALTVDTDDEITYTSAISAEDCYLCGGHTEDAGILPWGQNNVALISLNTFEIKPIEINRYDRLTGRLIEEATGTVSFGGGGQQDNSFTMSMLVDSDRGYATGTIDFFDDKTLDIEKAASFLCADCMNKVLPQRSDKYFGVGVINLSTKEIKLFEENVVGFGVGDFYIDCYEAESSNSSDRMHLSIFFCPVRYAEVSE